MEVPIYGEDTELTGHTARVLHLAQVWKLIYFYEYLCIHLSFYEWICPHDPSYALPLQSPNGYIVASAATDETLRFWQVFGVPDTSERAKSKDENGAFSKCHTYIR